MIYVFMVMNLYLDRYTYPEYVVCWSVLDLFRQVNTCHRKAMKKNPGCLGYMGGIYYRYVGIILL